jgi:hypothetical protein
MIDSKILNKAVFLFTFTALFYDLPYILSSIMHKNAKLLQDPKEYIYNSDPNPKF